MRDKMLERYQAGGCSPVEDKTETLEDVNIQCLQSSEFVVGKQHNFNGPVTIINCAETPDATAPVSKGVQMSEEKIVIRDRVLSPSKEGAENLKSGMGSQENKGKWQDRTLEKLKKYFRCLIFVCVGILIVLAIGLGVFFATVSTADPKRALYSLTTPRVLLIAEGPATIGNHSFYKKEDWGGKPPTSSIEMKLPVPYVVVSHTVTSECYKPKACGAQLRNMQEYHFSLDFADISYNFLVDSRGNIYEGRGWTKRNIMGGFVNGRSIDVAMIGDYSQSTPPTHEMMDALKQMLEFAVENGKISRNYSLLAANSTFATLSPGQNVYNVIKGWPHFDPDPKSHLDDHDV